MTYRYADPPEVEAALTKAAALGLAAPEQLAGAMAWQAYSSAASCVAESAQLERGRCRLLDCRVVATGDDREVFAVALRAVAKRSRHLRRSLENLRSVPVGSRTVRP